MACMKCVMIRECALTLEQLMSGCTIVKRLRFRVFKEIANSIIAFWASLDSSPRT